MEARKATLRRKNVSGRAAAGSEQCDQPKEAELWDLDEHSPTNDTIFRLRTK